MSEPTERRCPSCLLPPSQSALTSYRSARVVKEAPATRKQLEFGAGRPPAAAAAAASTAAAAAATAAVDSSDGSDDELDLAV